MKQSKEFERAVKIAKDAWRWYMGDDHPDAWTVGPPPPHPDDEFRTDWVKSVKKCAAARQIFSKTNVRQPDFGARTNKGIIYFDRWATYRSGWVTEDDRTTATMMHKQIGKKGPCLVALDPYYAESVIDLETRHIPWDKGFDPTVLFACVNGYNDCDEYSYGHYLGLFDSVVSMKRASKLLMKRWLAEYEAFARADISKRVESWKRLLR